MWLFTSCAPVPLIECIIPCEHVLEAWFSCVFFLFFFTFADAQLTQLFLLGALSLLVPVTNPITPRSLVLVRVFFMLFCVGVCAPPVGLLPFRHSPTTIPHFAPLEGLEGFLDVDFCPLPYWTRTNKVPASNSVGRKKDSAVTRSEGTFPFLPIWWSRGMVFDQFSFAFLVILVVFCFLLACTLPGSPSKRVCFFFVHCDFIFCTTLSGQPVFRLVFSFPLLFAHRCFAAWDTSYGCFFSFSIEWFLSDFFRSGLPHLSSPAIIF